MTGKQEAGSRDASAGKDQRQQRLRQALRENLKRRKSQARGRHEVEQPQAKPDQQEP